MSDVIKHSKKALSYVLTVSTIVWSVGLFALAPQVGATAGDLIKSAGSTTVYLVDTNGVTIHPIPHARVYHSWGFDPNYKTVITTNLSGFTVGNDVEFRDGSLVRAQEKSDVYVKSAGKLRPILSSETAKVLKYDFKNVTWLPQTFIDKYTKGDMISSTTTHPDGTLVKYASSAQVYLIQGGQKRAFASTDVSKVNGFGGAKTLIPVITIPDSETYPDGTQIVVRESALTVPVGVGTPPVADSTGTPVPAVPAGSGLTVAVASDNPVASTILADSDANTYPQGQIPFLKVNFTAGADGAVKVTGLKFKRTGVSADSDIGNLYLYDGETKLAEYNSFSDKVAVFSNSSGLFTVNAGTAKTITLKGDLARGSTSVTSGKTVGFDLVAAADVTTDKATPAGNFPVAGALMSTAAVSDLGHIYLTSYTTYPTTIKADAANQEVWRFTVNASSQNMQLRYLKLTEVGTILTTDIKDLKLEVGGVQVGTTQQLASDKTVIFDLTSAPYAITSGQSKVFVLRGSMAGGAGKSFKFSIQRQADIVTYDANYAVFNSATITGDTTAFALIEPVTTAGTSVSSGTITTGVATDSPTGNVADGASSVTLAKFSFYAAGEAVKIESLDFTVAITNSDGGEASVGLVNVKTLLDGSQIGTTASTMSTSSTVTTFTYGNTFQVAAGATRYITVTADLTNANLEANDTIAVTMAAKTGNAQGVTTLSTLNTTAQTGRTLTAKSGKVSVTKNTAFADRSSTTPTGTATAQAAQIASFVIAAGAGEAVDVTQVVLKDASTVTQMGDNFQNLKIKNGETQIGETIGSLDSTGTAATYTFTPATAIRINAGSQYVVNVYADIKSSPADSATTLSPVILVSSISATGVSTSADAGCTGEVAATSCSGTTSLLSLQNGYVSANGNLTITQSADTPVAQQVVMGTTDQEVAKFKLAASTDEDISISDIYVAATLSAAATGTWSNLKLYNGTTPIGSATNFGTTSTTTYAVAQFSGLTLTVPKNSNIILTLKADVSAKSNATTNSTATFALLPDYDGATAGNQEAITAKGASSGTAITGDSMDFGTAGSSADAAVSGNQLTVYATKISVAHASDAPSGVSTQQQNQTVMKFIITNTANVDSYSATIRYINFNISNNYVSRAGGTRVDLNVYKDTAIAANLVGTTSWLAAGTHQIGDTAMATQTSALVEGSTMGFAATEIASGSNRTFLVTLDTDGIGLVATESFSINIGSDDIAWRDGVHDSDITSVNTLPLSTKTFTY